MSPTERPEELFPGEHLIVGIVVGVLVMGAYITLDLNGWSFWYRFLASAFVLIMSIIVVAEIREFVSKKNRGKVASVTDGEATDGGSEEIGEDQPSVVDDHRPDLDALVAEALRRSEAVKSDADRFGNAGGTLGIFAISRVNTAARKAQEAAATQDEAEAAVLAQRAIRLAEKAVAGLEYARTNAPQAAAKEFATVAKEAKLELRRAEDAPASDENDAEIIRARRAWKAAKKTSKSYRERAKEHQHREDMNRLEAAAKEDKGIGCGGVVVAIVVGLFIFFVVLPLGGLAACGAILADFVGSLAGH